MGNLDEFLFEFLRPYLEAKLSPLYDRFKDSPYFLLLSRDA